MTDIFSINIDNTVLKILLAWKKYQNYIKISYQNIKISYQNIKISYHNIKISYQNLISKYQNFISKYQNLNFFPSILTIQC